MAISPNSLLKAQSRLRIATGAVENVKKSKTFEQFYDAWVCYLEATKNIYTSLEQGSKNTPQDMQWFGIIKSIRKNDELLQYLFQARNDENHGVNLAARYVSEKIVLSGVTKVTIENGTIKGFNESVSPVSGSHRLPHVRINAVTGRGNVNFHPPKVHLGKQIESYGQLHYPIEVCQLGLDYFSHLVQEAQVRT